MIHTSIEYLIIIYIYKNHIAPKEISVRILYDILCVSIYI